MEQLTMTINTNILLVEHDVDSNELVFFHPIEPSGGRHLLTKCSLDSLCQQGLDDAAKMVGENIMLLIPSVRKFMYDDRG
jgi:hypothetical protein